MAIETKLTLEIYRYENLVFGKCKYLKTDLLGKGVLVENNRYQIVSDIDPNITLEENQKSKLSVWGNNELSRNNIFKHTFSDPEEAEEFTMNIVRLINKLNGTNSTLQTLVKVL